MMHSENKHRLRRVLPRAARWRARTGVRPLLPLLAPFLVSVVFILLYCGPNIPRGLGCLVTSRLVLASGHRDRQGPGTDGSRTFSADRLGDRIGAVVRDHCGRRPAWWGLDFWVDPDPYAVISVENRPTAGSEDGVRRLLAGRGARDRADLAIVQDGLVADGAAPPGKVRSLVILYHSVLCAFAPKGGRVGRLADLRGRNPRVYTGQAGSGARVLARRVLDHLGIDYQDACPDRTPDEVGRAMAGGGGAAGTVDVAFVLDRPDSGAVRTFVECGRFDLLSLEGAEDLFRSDELLRSSTTTRPVVLPKGALSLVGDLPPRDVTTVETQAVLACSTDLPDWDAYQVTRTLVEHARELGLGDEAAEPVASWDPGAFFDDPVHPGALRYYRQRERAESFPYSVLVVAIGASVALVVYWQNQVLKWRADRVAERVDAALLDHHDDPALVLRRLNAARLRAVILYKDGRINKEGFERICEHVRVLAELFEARRDAGAARPRRAGRHPALR
jgi:TRAP transporter TAXI family solute receptor